jgi:hypothetical protein
MPVLPSGTGCMTAAGEAAPPEACWLCETGEAVGAWLWLLLMA